MITILTDLKALVGAMPSKKRYESDPGGVDSLDAHLSETISWLLNSIRFSKDSSGSAQSYRLFRGWTRSFPETTGYIIPTLFDYGRFARINPSDLRTCAISLGEWLMSIQMESGACMGGLFGTNPKPSLFNTGQNLLGFNRLYKETNDDRFLQAAIRSADFILGCQDDTGAYVRHTYSAIVACYNVRSAWATLDLGLALGNEKYISSAWKNIQWTMSQQQPNGWFSNNTFSLKKNPNTHSIAYVLEGLIESYALLRHQEILDAAVRTADGMLSRYESNGWISGEHDSDFTYLRPYTCVTGNLQLAGVWLKIYSLLSEPRYLHGASNMVQWYLRYHNIRSKNPGIRGGVHGSIPHWGRYAPLKYPNWAAKFFCDTLMALIPILERVRKTVVKEGAHTRI